MSVWVAGIGAAVTVGTALYSSNAQKQAAKGAAGAQERAAQKSSDTQMAIFDKQTELQAPWRNAGASSIGYLSYLMGVPGYQSGQFVDPNTKPANPASGPHGGGGGLRGNGFSSLTETQPSWVPSVQALGRDPNRGGESIPAKGQIIPSNTLSGLGGSNTQQSAKPQFASPQDPGFQALPSGSRFVGPDGLERVKH